MRPLGACCKTGWAGARHMGLDPLRVPNGLCESIAPLLPKERPKPQGGTGPSARQQRGGRHRLGLTYRMLVAALPKA